MDPRTFVVECCARAAHEVNRVYCIYKGDWSQPPWESAPPWQIESAKQGVIGVLQHGNGPKDSHEDWMRQKLADGWIFGPDKDPEKKTHPCLVEYDELPPAQKEKDALFVSTVHAVHKAIMGQLSDKRS